MNTTSSMKPLSSASNSALEERPKGDRQRLKILAERREQRLQSNASKIADAAQRDRFVLMMKRANALADEAARLRLTAWADWRRLVGRGK